MMIVLATSVTLTWRVWEICRIRSKASLALQPRACIKMPFAWSTRVLDSADARSCSAVRCESP